MKDLDDFITDIVTKEINKPEEYKQAIRSAFDKKTYKQSKFSKIVVTVCSLLIVITGIAYATDIKEFVIKNFYTNDKGMDTAIQNGYIDETEKEYVTSEEIEAIINNTSIEAYDTEIGIKNMLMDDYNLSFTFSIKVSENIDISKLMTVRFNKFIISDENDNILYCDFKEFFDEYCLKNNLDYDFYNDTEHNICFSMVENYIVNKDIDSNTIDIIFNISNNRDFSYPKSKKLNIIIEELYMGEEEHYANDEPICLKGNWNLVLDVNEKFSNRDSINYNVKKCDYADINITQAKLDNTGFNFKCTLFKEPLYNDNISQEEKFMIIKEFQKYYFKEEYGRIIPDYITNCYLEDELGNKYYAPEKGIANPFIWDFAKGELYYKTGFTYTQSDQTNKIKIYFTINLPNDVRDVCIELEK